MKKQTQQDLQEELRDLGIVEFQILPVGSYREDVFIEKLKNDNYKVKYPNRIDYYNDSGDLHRDNGPAIEYDEGYKSWFLNGKRHRLDGPAVEGIEEKENLYWINGAFYEKDAFEKQSLNIRLSKINQL